MARNIVNLPVWLVFICKLCTKNHKHPCIFVKLLWTNQWHLFLSAHGVERVQACMAINRLLLNSTKTGFIWLGSTRRFQPPDVHFCAAVYFRCQYSTVSACSWSRHHFGQWSYTHRSRQPHRFCLLFPLTPAAFDSTISDDRHCTRHGSCTDPQLPELL